MEASKVAIGKSWAEQQQQQQQLEKAEKDGADAIDEEEGEGDENMEVRPIAKKEKLLKRTATNAHVLNNTLARFTWRRISCDPTRAFCALRVGRWSPSIVDRRGPMSQNEYVGTHLVCP